LEPARIGSADRKRPDLEVLIGPKRFLVDVYTVHPGAESYAPKAAEKQLWTAAFAESRKVRKYAVMAAEAGADFFPFVVESTGGWGITEFIDAFVTASADSHSAWCPHEFVYGIVRMVGVAVQRGNAWMAEGALQLARRQD
jgi:hypothetical protein